MLEQQLYIPIALGPFCSLGWPSAHQENQGQCDPLTLSVQHVERAMFLVFATFPTHYLTPPPHFTHYHLIGEKEGWGGGGLGLGWGEP